MTYGTIMCRGNVARFSKIKVKSEPEVEDDEHTSLQSTDIDGCLSEDDDCELIPPLPNAPHASYRSIKSEESNNSLMLNDSVAEVEGVGKI